MFDGYLGAEDPAQLSRVAHDTAAAILARVRADPDPEVVARLVTYTDEHGVDAIAELWSHASARSLPGALWRVYLLRTLIRQDPVGLSLAFQRGTEVSRTIDQVVAGAAIPAGPDEVRDLADRSCADSSPATSRWRSSGRRRSRGSPLRASRASPTTPTPPTQRTPIARRASRPGPCDSSSSPTSSHRAPGSGGETRSTETDPSPARECTSGRPRYNGGGRPQ